MLLACLGPYFHLNFLRSFLLRARTGSGAVARHQCGVMNDQIKELFMCCSQNSLPHVLDVIKIASALVFIVSWCSDNVICLEVQVVLDSWMAGLLQLTNSKDSIHADMLGIHVMRMQILGAVSFLTCRDC